MILLNGRLRWLMMRLRDRFVRGLRHDVAENRGHLGQVRGDLAEAQRRLAETRQRLDKLSAAVAVLCQELDTTRTATDRVAQAARELVEGRTDSGDRANKALAETGFLVNLTPAQRAGDGTLQGALGYPTWEQSVAEYRPAFQRAIDYLRGEKVYGPVVEFGTCTGFTARIICELLVGRSFDVDVYLYDSFEGLPDMTGTPDEHSYDVAANGSWFKGAMSVPAGYEEHVRQVLATIRPADRVHIVKGFYEQTLDAALPTQKCSLVHVDCDIYTSSKYVLSKLAEKDLLQDGCVLMFDDWNCNRASPDMGERRALAEFLAENPRWACTPWFFYGWNGHAAFLHDRHAGR